jgi:hypothetical protein
VQEAGNGEMANGKIYVVSRMSSYEITERTKMKARLLGVSVKTSKNPDKKIDVFKNGMKIATVGQAGALDYPNYLKKDPLVAEKRRLLYKKRHEKDRKVVGSAGYYADRLLWN